MLPFVPASNPAVARAQALAADLRYLFRKHRARVVWREELDGRVTISAVIEGVPEAGSLVAAMGPKFPWWIFFALTPAISTLIYFIESKL